MSLSTSTLAVNNNLNISTQHESLDKENQQPATTDKKKEVWVNSIKADGGAYKGCPKNDYCQHFVDTSERPQNFIRDYEEEKRFLDYPKLNELIKRKNEVLQKRATPAMWHKCDLKSYDLSTLGKFDVILIDPPLPEYQKRTEGLGIDSSNLTPWSFEELSNLRIDHLAENCCFLFLWVGSSEGLDKGRLLLKKWNFRRCEDIVWIKTNKHNFKRRYYNDGDTLLQHTKEHCLVGIKGQVKRGVDGHFIHANIDTDVIVSEEPPLGSGEKPAELYRIIERFCLGRKRIELFGEDHNRRPGWLTLGKSLSGSNLDIEKYNNYFRGDSCYPEVQGYEGGRFVGCTPEIENLRPRSPTRNASHSGAPKGSNLSSSINSNSNMNMNAPSFINNFNIGIGFNFNQGHGQMQGHIQGQIPGHMQGPMQSMHVPTLPPMSNMNSFMPYQANPFMWNGPNDLQRMNSAPSNQNFSHANSFEYSSSMNNLSLPNLTNLTPSSGVYSGVPTNVPSNVPANSVNTPTGNTYEEKDSSQNNLNNLNSSINASNVNQN
jgi:N6-adenosine-specific RNA methylase IME4